MILESIVECIVVEQLQSHEQSALDPSPHSPFHPHPPYSCGMLCSLFLASLCSLPSSAGAAAMAAASSAGEGQPEAPPSEVDLGGARSESDRHPASPASPLPEFGLALTGLSLAPTAERPKKKSRTAPSNAGVSLDDDTEF